MPNNDALLPGYRYVPLDTAPLDGDADTVVMRCAAPGGLTSYIWWTFNGGAEWIHFPEALADGSDDFLAIHPRRHDLWFHIGSATLHRSTDYGQTWQIGSFPFYGQGQKQAFHFDPDLDSTIYFAGAYVSNGTESFGGAWVSEDLGQTWTSLLDLMGLFGLAFADVYDVFRMSNGDLIAILRDTGSANWQNGTVLISSDSGSTWERVFAGLPDRFNPFIIIEDRFQPGTLLVCSAEKHGVYRSEDYGHTWSRCENGFPPNVAITTDLEQNDFSGSFYACVAGFGVYRSDDHGGSWHSIESLPPIGSIGYFGAVDANVFVMNDGYRHWLLPFGSSNWQEVFAPLAPDTLVQMRPISYCSGDTLVTGIWKRNVLGAATNSFQMAHSYDRGVNWSLQPFLDFLPAWFFSVGKVQDQTLFFSFDGTFLRRSSDLGISWSITGFPQAFRFDRDIIFTDTCIFMDASNGQLNEFDVFKSYDLGDTWEPLGFPGPFVSGNSLLTRVGNELVIIAQDSCWAWANGQWSQRGTIELPDAAVNNLYWMIAVPLEESTVLLGLTEFLNQAWVSADTGRSWQVRNTEMPYGGQSMGFEGLCYSQEQNRVWAIAGIGTCFLDPVELSADGPLEFKPVDYSLLSVYPNPFNGEVSISYDLFNTQRVELKIYDLQGRLVITMIDDVQAAGKHEIKADMREMASGVYFVRLVTARNAKTEKIVLLK